MSASMAGAASDSACARIFDRHTSPEATAPSLATVAHDAGDRQVRIGEMR
jgi:hypothetical protein